MYQDLIAVLTLALQAQDKEVRSLRQDVDRLEATVASLQKDFRSLRDEMDPLRRKREAGRDPNSFFAQRPTRPT
jgi:predicted RNase H-like nuclease (RuvC/YqgF family)